MSVMKGVVGIGKFAYRDHELHQTRICPIVVCMPLTSIAQNSSVGKDITISVRYTTYYVR